MVRRGLVPLLVVFVVAAAAAANRPSLVDAAKNGDRDALRALLQKGASVNAAEPDGTTALHWASYRDDVEAAGLLIRAGAKVNAANDLGATPLWTASLNGSEAMVRQLLAAGANPERGAPRRRNAADGRLALRQARRRRAVDREGRQRQRARRAQPDGADVGGVAEASRMSSRCCSRTAPTCTPDRTPGAR